jgi:hypothetical protein
MGINDLALLGLLEVSFTPYDPSDMRTHAQTSDFGL